MTQKTVFEGEINYTQALDPDGNLDPEVIDEPVDSDWLTSIYKTMVLARLIDEKSLKLQRQGRLGTYAPYKGQEAAQVASVDALDDSDLIVPSYRDGAALLARGVPVKTILLYWGGDERGNTGLKERNVFPVSIPVGSHPVHVVGAIRARMIRGEDNPFGLTYFGDGATSEGDLMEALNFAGTWNTPILFFCQNNQWAISVPREKQTASETLAQKAFAFGFDGEQVDGNDPIAVNQAVKQARKRALEEETPYLIEAITYRRGDHTTADDASRYRSSEEVSEWEHRDPLTRTRLYLERETGWTDANEEEWRAHCEKEISEYVESYEQVDDPNPRDMFRYTYQEMTPQLQQQAEELTRELTDE